MDKTYHVGIGVKNRQGFALMITLSVLSVIIALTMVLLSYFEEVQQDASHTKALIQADVYYADIITIFQGIKDKKMLFSLLYRTALPLQTPDKKFSIVLQCNALNKGVNINWLGLANNVEKSALYTAAQNLFDFLSQEYEIRDPARLLEMLGEEIDNRNNLISREKSRLHQKNGIISYQQFEALLIRYQFEADDLNIGLVPWEKYFSFFPMVDKIDAEYSSPELIAHLFEMDVFTANEWVNSMDLQRESLASFVDQNGGNYAQQKSILADKEFLDATECSVGYAFAQEQYRFRFEHIRGEAKHFEFYGKQ
jgi:hypothetical protein